MVWVKLSDRHPREARKAGLTPQERALHVDALCWIMENDNETQHIDPWELVRLSTQPDPGSYVPGLLRCGWWVQHPEAGWDVIHDIPDQRTHQQIVTDRKKNAGRQAKWRANGGKPGNAGRNGVTNEGPVPVVVTPNGVTTKQNLISSVNNAVTPHGGNGAQTAPAAAVGEREPDLVREDVERLCTRLADLIEANGSRRPRITGKWRNEARLLLDRDRREPDKVTALIEWCQANSFWRSKILSMPKFRDKYDALRLEALRDWERSRGRGGAAPDRQANAGMRGGSRQTLKAAGDYEHVDPGSLV